MITQLEGAPNTSRLSSSGLWVPQDHSLPRITRSRRPQRVRSRLLLLLRLHRHHLRRCRVVGLRRRRLPRLQCQVHFLPRERRLLLRHRRRVCLRLLVLRRRLEARCWARFRLGRGCGKCRLRIGVRLLLRGGCWVSCLRAEGCALGGRRCEDYSL